MTDDNETVGLFEPLMVTEGSPKRALLNDLALELEQFRPLSKAA